jgi:hypothetical protein
MNVYNKAAIKAAKALAKYGTNVVISHKSTGTYNPATRTAPVTTVTENGVGMVLDWGSNNYPANGEDTVEGTLIKTGDRKLILSPFNKDTGLNLTPLSIGDLATINGVVYTITNPIKPLSPSGIVVLIVANIRV